MRSPAAAVAWEFRQRHRWGLIALAAYLLVLAGIKFLFFAPGQGVRFDNEVTFALAVVVPLTASLLYFLAVFSFGLSGDLAARQSIYPARMFTLPVTSSALAGWPMLFGTAAMAILWLATRIFAMWPSGVDIPIMWPALLAASLLAWTQALTWMPYPLRGLRVIVTVLWLTAIDSVVMVALHYKSHEGALLAILAPHVPLAFLVARFAVAKARRGDVPEWRGVGRQEAAQQGRESFPSAARAQAWFEWRLYGRSLPALVAILLPFEFAMLFIFRDVPVIVFETVAGVLLTPPFMAAFVAATVSTAMTPFIATRPLTDASLIAAKLRATMRSTLAAWLLVLMAVPIALKLSGTSVIVIEKARQLVEIAGAPRAIAITLLGLLLFMASTWKQLIQSLYIGMSGREWLVKTSVFVTLSLIALVGLAGFRNFTLLWSWFPWIAAVLVCLKVGFAAWIAIRLSGRGLIAGAVCWDLLVFALFGLLVWIFPDLLVHRYLLALIAILEVPLVRVSAAPLALAWNRHR